MFSERPFVNITPVARDLKRSGSSGAFDEVRTQEDGSKLSREDLSTIRSDIKIERFALTTVIVDRVIDRAFRTHLAEATPDSLPWPHTQTFTFLEFALHTSLVEELRDLKDKSNDDNCTDPIKEVCSRYLEVIMTGYDYEINGRSPENQILAGIKTVTEIMTNTINVIPIVHKRERKKEIDEHKIQEIAKNSFPLISSLASMHSTDFEMVRHYITQGDGHILPRVFKPERFSLRDTDAGSQLYLKDNPHDKKGKDVKRLFREVFGPGAVDDNTPRLRCPAIVNLGEGSAIKRLWDYYITL